MMINELFASLADHDAMLFFDVVCQVVTVVHYQLEFGSGWFLFGTDAGMNHGVCWQDLVAW